MTKSINLVNLTPHRITILSTRGATNIEPSGIVARVATKDIPLHREINGVPIFSRELGEVHGVPKEEKADTVYIVSFLVLSALPQRKDIAAPDTGRTAVKNPEGKLMAIQRFIMNE